MKKIRTESGVWIPATYKTNRYSMWKEKNKINEDNEDDSEEESPQIQACKSLKSHQLQTNISSVLSYLVLKRFLSLHQFVLQRFSANYSEYTLGASQSETKGKTQSEERAQET